MRWRAVVVPSKNGVEERADMAEVLVSFVFTESIEAIWVVLRDFDGLPSWLPGASNSEIENGRAPDQVGAVRRFCLGPGGDVVRERLLSLSDLDHACTYLVLEGPLPVRNMVGEIRAREITETGGTFVSWRASFGVEKRDEPTAVEQLKELYASGLSNLRKIIISGRMPT